MKGIGFLLLTSAVLFLSALVVLSAPDGVKVFRPADSGDVYVSPAGDDRAAGTIDAPVATAKAALARVRERRASGALDKSRRAKILFASGTYSISEPLVIDAADSHVELAAKEPGKAMFSAGRRLPPFEQAKGGLWKVNVPRGFTCEQLWVNGALAARARTPNEFYLYIKAPADEIFDPDTGERQKGDKRAFFAYPKDVQPLAKLSPAELGRVVVRHYHSWEVTQGRALSVDPKSGLVIETPSSPWGFFYWPMNEPRYVLENYREALDAPGEWFLDVDKSVLWYMPRRGETLSNTRAVVPVADRFIEIRGDRKSGRRVQDVVLRGLTFRYAGYRMPAKGQFSPQAVIDVHGAITVADAEEVTLSRCRIERVAPHGVHFDGGSSDCRMESCAVKDIGGGAVAIGRQVGATDRPVGGPRVERIAVEDCILQRGGRIFPGAVGVWIGYASEISLRHNDIGDFLYSGVSMGWTWGFAKTTVRNNDISYNHIHHVGQGVLSDLGGIYTLGQATGTKVIGNRIHDVYSYDYTGRGGWGLYTDNGSAEIYFESNLVYRTKTGGVHQLVGRNNVFRNNILAYTMDNMVQRSRTEGGCSFSFKNNIVLWDNQSAAVCNSSMSSESVADLDFASNLYWNAGGLPTNAFFKASFADWQKGGHDAGSIFADPLFANPEKDDFTLSPASPAFALGFKEFDWKSAGVRGTDEWKAEAAACDPGPVRFAPKPRPVSARYPLLTSDFETLGASGGKFGQFFKTFLGAGSDAYVKATDKTAHGGKYSLEVKDSPKLKLLHEPLLFKHATADSGLVTISFMMKCGEGADVRLLLRQLDGDKVESGPIVRFCGGKATAEGKTLSAPYGNWFAAEATLDFGSRKWKLAIAPDGGAWYDTGWLAFPKKFVRLDWIGLSSDSSNDAVWNLDDFRYENVE